MITWRTRRLPAFQVCGCLGLELAVLLALGLVLYQGRSPWVMGAVIASAIGTFYLLAFATKIITGEEQLIYYHHEIGVLLNAALLLTLLGQPPLPYLDATILGVGMFLTCGRIGCLMVGCCHGRPCGWGVRYRPEHAEAGFPAHYVGVRLFPIQAVESLWVLGVVLVGSSMVLGGAAPGAALAWYVVMYDLGRFCFEFVRGDSDRTYMAGFSEGQWISLGLTLLVAALELAGVLPLHDWHLAVAVGLALVMLLVTLWRRRQNHREHLLRPAHLREIARALTLAEDSRTGVAHTSRGLHISTGVALDGTVAVRHYTLSRSPQPLAEADARAIAGVIRHLRHQEQTHSLRPGNHGTFHVVVPLP
jgi:hypothetical protein